MAYQVGVLNLQHYNTQTYESNFNFKKPTKFQIYTSKISQGLKFSLKSRKTMQSLTPPLIVANLIESPETSNTKNAFALTMLPLHRSKIVHFVRHD